MKRVFVFLILITQPVFAYYTENIPNQCGVIGNNLFAVFEINTYTCESGYFLPADTLGCVQCPNGYTCNGGTFSYNATESQGAIKSSTYITHNLNNMCSINAPHNMSAIFTPNIYACTPGYYLPANVDECRPCQINNKCVGGTYTFNETLTQGIEQCENGYFAPTGSAVCYPHILHIDNNNVYLKPDKTTTPSLNVQINNDIFYANMTTIPTPMNKDTSQYLKINYNDMIYYMHDDTIQ